MLPLLQFALDPPKATKALLVAEANPDPSASAAEDRVLEVQFNPATLKLDRGVQWRDSLSYGAYAYQEFYGGQADKLSFKITFDTTLPGEEVDMLASLANQALMLAPIPGVGPGGALNRLLSSGPPSVMGPIDKLITWTHPAIKLSDAEKVTATRPPGVLFSWGEHFQFAGAITRLGIELTTFFRDGTPVRANVDIAMAGRYLGPKLAKLKSWDDVFHEASKDPEVVDQQNMLSAALSQSGDGSGPSFDK